MQNSQNSHIIKETARGLTPIEVNDNLMASRKIFINGEINEASSRDVIQELMTLVAQDPNAEITVFINSGGGESRSGLAIYDVIRMVQAPIKTVCVGLAASMGAIIYLAGDEREILPNSEIMIHDPLIYGMNRTKALDLQRNANHVMKIREVIAGIIAERTNKSLEEVYSLTQNDTFFNAQEAIDFGLAHRITTKL